MTVEKKRDKLYVFCGSTRCDKCPLNYESLEWSKLVDDNRWCLNIARSPEDDIDRALKIVEEYRAEQKKPEPKTDVVNRPAHYTDGKIEVIEFIEDKKLGFCLGNAVKYIARAGKKDPSKEIEDLKKAEWYIKRRIKELENETS